MITKNFENWYKEQQIGEVSTIIGNPGFGKSSLSDKIFEEYNEKCIGKKLIDKWNITCIDPAGIHYVLRSVYDDIVIIGGDHGDVDIENIGEVLPILMDKGINFIVDIFEYSLDEQREIVGELFEYFYIWHKENRRLRNYQLEECDYFISQYKFDIVCKNNIQKCMTKGRMNGMGFTLITQNFTMIDKLILKMTANYLLFNMQYPLDLKTIKDLVGEDIADKIKKLGIGKTLIYNREGYDSYNIKKKKSPSVASTPKLGVEIEDIVIKDLNKDIKRLIEL